MARVLLANHGARVKQDQSKGEKTFDSQLNPLYTETYSAHLGLIRFNFKSIQAVHSNCLFVCLFVCLFKVAVQAKLLRTGHWTELILM